MMNKVQLRSERFSYSASHRRTMYSFFQPFVSLRERVIVTRSATKILHEEPRGVLFLRVPSCDALFVTRSATKILHEEPRRVLFLRVSSCNALFVTRSSTPAIPARKRREGKKARRFIP